MIRKYYILALTFLCILSSQASFGQNLNENGSISGGWLLNEVIIIKVPKPTLQPLPCYSCFCNPSLCIVPIVPPVPCYSCACNPSLCFGGYPTGGGGNPPNDNPPGTCELICIGEYFALNQELCQCDKLPRPWYYDGDGDEWHDGILGIRTQIESPGTGWRKTTKGVDCDDKNILINKNCYKDYFIDNDGDGYDGGTISAKDQGQYKTTTLGADCDDSNASVYKNNKCGKCEVEPVGGVCDLPCNTFAERIKDILAHEGGYVNNPNDPGKETNKGITIAVWQKNAQSLLNIEPTSANLKALTDTQAAVLYKALYWDKIQAEDIVDGDIRYLLFDFFVNAGGNAVKVIQKTLNQLGNNLSNDGIIGNSTINAINNTNSVQLYNNFKANRQQYYNSLAIRSTKMATFLNGWTNRVNNFKNKTTTNNKNVNCN